MVWVGGGTRIGLCLVVKEENPFSIGIYEDESIAYTLQRSSKKRPLYYHRETLTNGIGILIKSIDLLLKLEETA
jgi:hypothetical protein